MKKVYNYKKINKRIEELNSKRNENERFIGTFEELDELMDLSTYNREKLAHALCLDFKSKVTYIENYFPYGKGLRARLSSIVIELDKIAYTAEVEDLKEAEYFNYTGVLVLKPLSYGEERRFKLECKDVSCCSCYYVKEELVA